MTQDPLRVAVVSRYQLVRAGLATLIHSDPSRAIVVDSATVVRRLERQDVTIYDLAGLAHRPGQRDSDREADLRRLLGSSTPVVCLARDGHAELTRRATELGVRQLVAESVTSTQLLDNLERATGRRTAPQGEGDDPFDHLTPRELEVLRLIAVGVSNKQIAAHLFVSVNTVKSYIRTCYRKIGAARRPEAVLWAVHHGLAPRPADSVPGVSPVESPVAPPADDWWPGPSR